MVFYHKGSQGRKKYFPVSLAIRKLLFYACQYSKVRQSAPLSPAWQRSATPHQRYVAMQAIAALPTITEESKGFCPYEPLAPPSLASLRTWGDRRSSRWHGPRQARGTERPPVAEGGGWRRSLALAGSHCAPRDSLRGDHTAGGARLVEVPRQK
jgi:hypothetical protein